MCTFEGAPGVIPTALTCSSLMYSTALMRKVALSDFSLLGSRSRRAAKLQNNTHVNALQLRLYLHLW